MTQEDMKRLQGDMARLNAALSSQSVHDQMRQVQRAHAQSMKEMSKAMADMQKQVSASFNLARDAYRKTPEYKRMNDEITARAQWFVIPVGAATIFAVAVIMVRVLM